MQISLFQEDKYSIAIYPPTEVIEKFAAMKTRLALRIGWFNSRNSIGHITICEFKGGPDAEATVKTQLGRICSAETSIQLSFNYFGSYSNGAFCLFPDEESEEDLKNLMKRVQTQLGIRMHYKSTSPHMTIARKLDENKLVLANELFTDITMKFTCDRLVLRVLDPQKRQYKVIEELLFQRSNVIDK